MLLLSSKLKCCRNLEKRQQEECRFMQIKAFIQLIFLRWKITSTWMKREKMKILIIRSLMTWNGKRKTWINFQKRTRKNLRGGSKNRTIQKLCRRTNCSIVMLVLFGPISLNINTELFHIWTATFKNVCRVTYEKSGFNQKCASLICSSLLFVLIFLDWNSATAVLN